MWMRQIFVACICTLLATQQICAVVNNGSNSKISVEPTSSSTSGNVNGESTDSDSATLADSAAASSEKETSRRDVPLGLTDVFGTPVALEGLYAAPVDSYLPELQSNLGLPLPVYGVPNVGTNIIYPAPPPDIPPPLPTLPLTYGVPNNLGPPKITYGPAKIYGPPKYPVKYGPPFLQRPPKPFNPPVFNKGLKTFYGPTRFQSNLRPGKEQFGLFKAPKPFIGPPKPHYGPPKLLHGPPKQVLIASKPILRPPSDGVLNPPPLIETYGPPTVSIDIISDIGKQKVPINYGPPEPIPHGPPHPGAPAPPTPPDIKYDGWQPIPGLVSRPPSDLYGAPQQQDHNQLFGDFIPPAIGGNGVHSLGLQDNYKTSAVVSDSYGAPLNAVTGSGGIGHNIQQTQQQAAINIDLSNIGLANQDNSLSVVKSVGYELFNNNGGLGFGGGQLDTYTSPPANSFSSNGPYAAAHSYSTNTLAQSASFGGSFDSYFGSTGKQIRLPSSGEGLIPPNGLYGVTPSSQYGTPLFQPNVNNNLNALEINPPKHPVIFREPVPHGLIESIGNTVAQKDAQGIIESSHVNLDAPAYIPPPVPDITKPVTEAEPSQPSTLYSLPNINNPISFQNVVHGSSSAGLVSDFTTAFRGYGANLAGVDATFALPLKTSQINFNVDQTHNNAINIEQGQTAVYDIGQQIQGGSFGADQGHVFNGYNVEQNRGNFGFDFNSGSYQHDCSVHKSQPLPQLSYGVPSANTYTESLSSLKTNIGGSFPHLTYGPPDLQAAHSQSSVRVNSESSSNFITDNNSKENYGKSLGESFAAGGELIKSQSLDLNNIPVQGALGSYTLQIQAADGLGSTNTPGQVPHEQVLNDGLLQSILAAIEQPQAQNVNILGQPLLQHIHSGGGETRAYVEITNSPNGETESTSDVENRGDEEAQQSVKNSVVVSPPVTEAAAVQNTSKTREITQEPNADASLQLVDNNEIALYFSNNSDKQNTQGGGGASGQEDNVSEADKVLNGQQYGSYVSFKTPNTSYVYGDLKPSQNEQTSDVKE